MKFSSIIFSLCALKLINAAPAIHTVFSTTFTTVVVNVAGETIWPIPTPEPIVPEDEDTTTSTSTTTITITSETTIGVEPAAPTPEPANLRYGDGTYYDPGMGACGFVSYESEFVVAVSPAIWDPEMIDANPNHNPICGRKVRAYYQGNSVEVTIVDKCMGCAPHDLDFSPAAFRQIADQDLGRIKISWEWI
ncbi:uncharacterized protein J8A68_001238 [[Candida] subhashii]|uniref:RlpA-like protein double-psi beta-barrel domain-containing protein n=1 Tax=[Candida] subhashii TaxID=561895 RepID=A0A8J5QUP2_9ASCO|nr:uncharacterized protein J8A68_001238 [[Candida] subhashii]KAG7665182.1 hypothetical protein J8A68_001238 [[Candida] subhashii]